MSAQLRERFEQVVSGEAIPAFDHWLSYVGELSIVRILSGITSSGECHIGNYFGAMRQHVELQDEGRGDLLHRRLPLDDGRCATAP